MPNYNNQAYPYNYHSNYYTPNYYNSQTFMHNQPYFSSNNNTYSMNNIANNPNYINNVANYPSRTASIPLSNRANFFAPSSTGGILSGGKSMSGLLGSLRGFNWSTLFNGTQKTLSTVNQIIPLYYRAAPMIKNARTLLSVAKAVGKSDDNKSNNIQDIFDIDEEYENESTENKNRPTFF